MLVYALIGLVSILSAVPTVAQVRPAPSSSVTEAENPQPLETSQPGVTAHSSVGQVGQRQTRETAAEATGIKPMARIAGRIQNRVQNRISNRIDRSYDPRTNAADHLAIAENQARASSRPR